MDTWNPEAYLRFQEERTQPAKDLVSRIALAHPRSVVDLGCGPGNSTAVLRGTWPDADIVGVDNSDEMISAAMTGYPEGVWRKGDIGDLNEEWRSDLVFSNAALQWVPDHRVLIPGLFGLVRPDGALAVQLPANKGSAIHRALQHSAADSRWRAHTAGCGDLYYHDAAFYYSLLSPPARSLELWETTYYHQLDSHQDLISWYSSTGMRPFLDSLPEDARRDFQWDVLSRCKDEYPLQEDGKLLYPFKRLFFIAYA
jgi:trans-aconitate 2-methyltransferase